MKKILLLSLVAFLIYSCGDSRIYEDPISKIAKEKANLKSYSIILNDMNYEEDKDNYTHQYKIVYKPNDNPDTLLLKLTDWYIVSPDFFNKNIDNMGMALAEVNNYALTRNVSPPGYENYVGNQQYGHWENRGGHSFWAFYGQYMFMSHMFNMMSPRRSYYNDYRSYRGSGRTYYGPSQNGRSMYGTNGSSNSNSKSKWSSKGSTFKNKVRSKVKQSSRPKRTSSRSSTRSGRSSYRSSGGGFGK